MILSTVHTKLQKHIQNGLVSENTLQQKVNARINQHSFTQVRKSIKIFVISDC